MCIFLLGFFSYRNKRYGQFFLAVQTFTKKIFVVPLRNLKANSLIDAIGLMCKVEYIVPDIILFIIKNNHLSRIEILK